MGLHNAAIGGHTVLVDWLLGQPGLTLDDRDNEESTPLLLSVRWGHLALVQGLLARGASLAAKDQWGRNALHNAAVGGDAVVMEWLLDQPGLALEDRTNEEFTP